MDSGASYSVLNYPTYVTIVKFPNIKQTNTPKSSKTSNVANKTEVPILYYVTITLYTTIEDDSRQFIIPFAVADIKYNMLGTPFFEEYIYLKHSTFYITIQTPISSTRNLYKSYITLTQRLPIFLVQLQNQL